MTKIEDVLYTLGLYSNRKKEKKRNTTVIDHHVNDEV